MTLRAQDPTGDVRPETVAPARAYGFLQSLVDRWRDFSLARAVGLAAAAPKTDLPPADIVRLRQQMRDCLTARGGEASARARAIELGSLYLGLSTTGRRAFLDDAPLDICGREFALLLALGERVGNVVRCERLHCRVFGDDIARDPNNLQVLVSRLRRKLPAEVRVRAVRGEGYRLDVA